nr:hypothetical protein [Phycisphaerales bacterium]
VAAAAAFTALAAAIPPSDYSIEMGRYGAIWSVADKFPIVGGRSFFMVGLSLLAGPILLAWAAALPYRPRWIFLAVLAAFSATQLKNPYLYQRYAEPLLLILLPMAASLIPHHGHRSLIPRDPALPAFGSPVANLAAGLATPLRYAGPIFLAIVLALMGLQTMRTAVRPVILPEGSIGNPPRATPKAPGPPPVSTGDVQPTLAR